MLTMNGLHRTEISIDITEVLWWFHQIEKQKKKDSNLPTQCTLLFRSIMSLLTSDEEVEGEAYFEKKRERISSYLIDWKT